MQRQTSARSSCARQWRNSMCPDSSTGFERWKEAYTGRTLQLPFPSRAGAAVGTGLAFRKRGARIIASCSHHDTNDFHVPIPLRLRSFSSPFPLRPLGSLIRRAGLSLPLLWRDNDGPG